MATLKELEDSGLLVRIEVELNMGELPWRRVFGTQDFLKWLDEVLPTLTTTVIGGDTEPIEQVDAVFHEYIIGRHLDENHHFKPLSWTPDWSIWEFKTPDIRIFGWLVEKDAFVCAFGDMKDEIELMKKYGAYIAKTKYVRDQLPLNEPKYVASKEYDDVLSDKN